MITIDGRISVKDVASIAQESTRVALDPSVTQRVTTAYHTARELTQTVPTYGQTTGVGANRVLTVEEDDSAHGIRLLRSHAVDAGSPLPPASVRAMLAVRLAQLAHPGSGVNPTVLHGLERMLNENALPSVLEFGSIGTADTSALAGTALTLMGERPASAPLEAMARWESDSALSFMSSSALTLGRACLASTDLRNLLDANSIAFALSFVGLRGNRSPQSAAATAAIAAPGAEAVTARLRALLGGSGDSALIQDPFAFRAHPAIQAPLWDLSARLEALLASLINVAAENPLFVDGVNGPEVVHHGGFFQASLAVTVDSLTIALAQSIPTSLSRIRMMTEPNYTGGSPFLAQGPQGSSGIMMVEYVAASAYAEMVAAAAPSSMTTAVVSRGTEEDASFASQAIVQLERSLKAYRTVFACELVVAARLLRQKGVDVAALPSPMLQRAATVLQALPQDDEDRELRTDLATAQALVEELASCCA